MASRPSLGDNRIRRVGFSPRVGRQTKAGPRGLKPTLRELHFFAGADSLFRTSPGSLGATRDGRWRQGRHSATTGFVGWASAHAWAAKRRQVRVGLRPPYGNLISSPAPTPCFAPALVARVQPGMGDRVKAVTRRQPDS